MVKSFESYNVLYHFLFQYTYISLYIDLYLQVSRLAVVSRVAKKKQATTLGSILHSRQYQILQYPKLTFLQLLNRFKYIVSMGVSWPAQWTYKVWFFKIPTFPISNSTVVLFSRDRYEIIGLLKISHSIKQPYSSVCLKKSTRYASKMFKRFSTFGKQNGKSNISIYSKLLKCHTSPKFRLTN